MMLYVDHSLFIFYYGQSAGTDSWYSVVLIFVPSQLLHVLYDDTLIEIEPNNYVYL